MWRHKKVKNCNRVCSVQCVSYCGVFHISGAHQFTTWERCIITGMQGIQHLLLLLLLLLHYCCCGFSLYGSSLWIAKMQKSCFFCTDRQQTAVKWCGVLCWHDLHAIDTQLMLLYQSGMWIERSAGDTRCINVHSFTATSADHYQTVLLFTCATDGWIVTLVQQGVARKV